MPIYDYECPKCGQLREIVKTLSELDDPSLCPDCTTTDNQVEMVRLVGNAGFILKGTGWERDGYSTVVGDHPDWTGRGWREGSRMARRMTEGD